MPPDKQRGGPVVTRNRLNTADTRPAPSVTPGAHNAAGPRGDLRPAHASVYAPCAGRSHWWLAYVCPWCGHGHLGRARTEGEVPGPRRSRCGRLVLVLVARVYRGQEAA